jgi:hypothetical protein
MDLPFFSEAPDLARVVLSLLEAIVVMLAVYGPNAEGGSGFRDQRSKNQL